MLYKKVVLFGLGDLAAIAQEYFTHDSRYRVAGFTVDVKYLDRHEFMGLPVVPFETVETSFGPDAHDMHICIIYNNLNRTRAQKCSEAKAKGYRLASYCSSRASIAPSAKIGEHAFIFEDNTIQSFVDIGDNVILWSGNHVGHHSTIADNNFISSHVVISGHCSIEANCFIGVNSTLANNTVLGHDSWVSHRSILQGTIPPNSMVRSVGKSEIVPLNEEALFRSLARAAAKANS